MSTTKIVENPEVPGLECFLPPPPPPPPPVTPANNEDIGTSETGSSAPGSALTSAKDSTTTTTTTTEPAARPFQSMIPPAPYVMHPGMQAQPLAEDDSSDLYCPWYDASPYNVAAMLSPPTAATATIKIKSKPSKRKVDPAQDAEKVANAQKELSAMMKPLKCDLCTAVMNSTLQAKRHYEGKPHRKKVSMFLSQCAKKKSEDGQVTSTTNSDWQNYCDVCKTWFTSQIDASQHYAGKKHIRAANGGPMAKPAKKSQGQNQCNQVDSTGRFGIGVAFLSDAQPTTRAATVEGAVPTAIPPAVNVYTPPPYPTPLRCDLCGVSANRQDQLEMHKRGARHLRMLKLNGLPIPEAEAESVPNTTGPIDYSIYRTPSGQYYCAPCNLSLNSESTFVQHMESKKHKNQSNPKPPTSAATPAKKPRFEKK